MSRAEKKNDMEDVQLTQEDIQILSDYSFSRQSKSPYTLKLVS